MTNATTSDAVDTWVDVLLEWAAELGLHFGPSVELFVDPELDTGVCDYYFADHSTRAIFWLEDTNTTDLGLPRACSERHLSSYYTSRHVSLY